MLKRAGEEGEEVRKCLKVDEALEKELSEVQDAIHKVDTICGEKQLAVQMKFDKLKKAPYEKRAELLKNIPEFWKDTLMNVPNEESLYTPEEVEVLGYIEDIQLEECIDEHGSHVFHFWFKENPFFTDKKLSKKITIGPDSEPAAIVPAKINWTKKLEDTEDENCTSLFEWLESDEPPDSSDFGSLFREHVWEDAFDIYTQEYDPAEEEEDAKQ